MPCCGARDFEVKEQHKWDYINLEDFKATTALPFLSYLWLWILVIIAVAVYVADIFTAVKLLGFNQWSSQVDPKVPFSISKWIFAVCIIISSVLLLFEWLRAIKVIKRGSVADDYLDPLAVILQSITLRHGWRRFLVFAELTKSKKKVAWMAIFVYFQRKSAIRVLLAQGPRQCVNAITLYAIARKSNIIGIDSGSEGGPLITQLFENLRKLATENNTQTVILSAMLFTLIVWIFSVIFLIVALFLYLTFLWHYIKTETLTGYCRRKIETRLSRIVKAKTDKIWKKQQEKQEKRDQKELRQAQRNRSPHGVKKQPTIPNLKDDSVSFLSRSDSNATLPLYSPGEGKPPYMSRQPTMQSVMSGRPYMPSRSGTITSNASGMSFLSEHSDHAPLLSQPSNMGHSAPPPARTTTTSSMVTRNYGNPLPRGPQLPPLVMPPLATPPPSQAGHASRSAVSLPESAHPERHASPLSVPWRSNSNTPISAIPESSQFFEKRPNFRPNGLPSGPRQFAGPTSLRRDYSQPSATEMSPQQRLAVPQRSVTSPMDASGLRYHQPPVPPSLTPGLGSGRPRGPWDAGY